MDKELLGKVVNKKLKDSINEELSIKEREEALNYAMQIIDRQAKLDQLELDKKDRKIDWAVKGLSAVVVPIGIEVFKHHSKMKFMRDICTFEKDYTFTTTPGRSISSFFKWK